jgi:hypothetical protein
VVDDVQAFGIDFQRDCRGPAAEWLHQMRSDLGRLAAEILQVGPFLARRTCLAARMAVLYCQEEYREHPMKVLRAVAMVALLTGPAYAQMPNINLVPETKSMTPEEKEAEAARDKAYRESLKKIPDAKVSADPWGNVRTDTPKSVKPKTKTGSTAN